MRFVYDPLLVLLSLIVAIQASYVGLNLALRVALAFALQRRLLIAGAATSLAVGIWGMHFIGMLAAKSPVGIDYAVLPTLISFLVCVLVTGIAVFLASLRALRMLVVAAIVMGLGIAAMHYIGMEAVHAGMQMAHNPAFVIASTVIAIGASALALTIGNPKAIVFFVAILPLAVDLDTMTPPIFAQIFVVGAFCLVAVLAAYALAANGARALFQSARAMRFIDRGAAAIMAAAALAIATRRA